MKALLLILSFCSVIFAGELKILAAANLKFVLEEIKQEFLKDYPNETITITYLASGKAYAQIKNGLDVDIFFSADTQKPQALFDEGYGLFEPHTYALGKLVLCTTKSNVSDPSILTSQSIKHIAIANPKLAPYGVAAEEFLKKTNLYAKVKDKFVIGESIGGALSYVKSGAAEVGLNALSLVISDPSFSFLVLDSKYYSPIKQAFIVLKKSQNQALSRAFGRFIMSDYVQNIFVKYGYDRAI